MAIQSDFLMPLIVGIENVDSGEEKKIKQLQSNQDWHRGKFLLTMRTKEEIKKLLHPEAPDLKKYEPKAKDIDDKGLREELENILEKNIELSSEKTGTSVNDSDFTKIEKVQGIEITNFKGIQNCSFNTEDTNIVLITGPNGSGKSSFVQALTLGLTGYLPELKEDGKCPEHFFFYDEKEFKIQIKFKKKENAENQNYKLQTRIVVGKRAEAPKFYLQKDENKKEEKIKILRKFVPESWQSIFEKESNFLLYRLTTFLPEYVDLLFDTEAAEKNKKFFSLRDLFEPVPQELKELKERAKEEKEKIEAEDKELEDIVSERTEFLKLFQRLFNQINALKPSLSLKVESLPPIDKLDEFLKESRSTLEKALSTKIEKWTDLPDKIKDFVQPFKQETEIEKIEKQIRELEERKRELEEELKWRKEPEAKVSIPKYEQLLNLFETVSDYALITHWKESLKETALSDILRELELIDSNKAKNFSVSLNKWLERERKEGQEELEEKIKKIDKEIKAQQEKREQILGKYKTMKLVNDLEETLKGKKELEKMDEFERLFSTKEERQEKKTKLSKYIKKVEENLTPSEDLKQDFEGAINNVLKRFAMTEGLEEVKLVVPEQEENRYFIIQAKEKDNKETKREKEHFSLGQRAQIATAWMIAQRELAHACKDVEIPHRVIILDDPTATFDMTNLLSQAILLRQLAYHPDEERRYQLFIVSHHEEFTSRLLDLLCPPQGCSMKLIRFVKWTPDNGAETEVFEVENAPEKLEYSKEALKKGIKTYGELS